jgi:hypothetical protein
MVMHAIIPYAIGGSLDLYYFPNGRWETGIATKELSEMPDQGSSNNLYKVYELVMFTREPLSMKDALDNTTRFGRIHEKNNAILNQLAPYSAQARLNPFDTCEFPNDVKIVGESCLIFDRIGKRDPSTGFGLMVVVEIFPSEMSFAQKRGGERLIEKLMMAHCYPYSDLDRKPVA